MKAPAEGPAPEWRRLLRGGFAFQNAPFACHPLDAERARQMVSFAVRDGATREKILSEARSYLEGEIGLKPAAAEERLKDVSDFLRTFRTVRHKKSAWLVFWNSITPADQISNREIVTIFDSRKSLGTIKGFVEQFYVSTCYSLREKMIYSTRPKDNPYRAEIHTNHLTRSTYITCGHNPWLEARVIRNVRLEKAPDGEELLSWD